MSHQPPPTADKLLKGLQRRSRRKRRIALLAFCWLGYLIASCSEATQETGDAPPAISQSAEDPMADADRLDPSGGEEGALLSLESWIGEITEQWYYFILDGNQENEPLTPDGKVACEMLPQEDWILGNTVDYTGVDQNEILGFCLRASNASGEYMYWRMEKESTDLSSTFLWQQIMSNSQRRAFLTAS